MGRVPIQNKRKRTKKSLQQQDESIADSDDDTTVCSSPPLAAMMTVRDSKNNNKTRKNAIVNPFTMLPVHIHQYILSFLTCLRTGYATPARTAVALFVQAHRDTVGQGNEYILASQFQMLPEEQQKQWYAYSHQDYRRCCWEEQQYTRPHTLVDILQNLTLVSQQWRDVVGMLVNAHSAPREILSPHELAGLKSRALSLSFGKVSQKFMRSVECQYGRLEFPEHDYFEDDFGMEDDRSPLQVIQEHFEIERKSGGMADVVAVEYARFLVLRCVELLAQARFERHYSTESDTENRNILAAWKQPSRPCEIVDLFWKAHLTAFPKQYARDCATLLRPLLGAKADLLDCIIDYDSKRNSAASVAKNYYPQKRAVLFRFETQLADNDLFYGKFGTYCVELSTECLLQDSLDIVRVAKECREEADNQDL